MQKRFTISFDETSDEGIEALKILSQTKPRKKARLIAKALVLYNQMNNLVDTSKISLDDLEQENDKLKKDLMKSKATIDIKNDIKESFKQNKSESKFFEQEPKEEETIVNDEDFETNEIEYDEEVQKDNGDGFNVLMQAGADMGLWEDDDD